MKNKPLDGRCAGTLESVLNDYADRAPARFHMPGHKGRMTFGPLAEAAPFDVTELRDTDDLSAPSGVLLGIEERYAELYGASSSMLLVNGSTAGNIAMMLALGSGKRVLLARNCHKSALAGAALAGHEVIPVFPDEGTGTITPKAAAEALEGCRADALFITSPTYYGACSDIDGIACEAHSRGALLFVDAAHGAHFPLSRQLPPVPTAADAWTVSCHKTLAAFTQTAVLNIGRSCPIPPERFRRMLGLVQTSSPSYPLMLSLENAVLNAEDWELHCERIRALRDELGRLTALRLWSAGSGVQSDITRLVFGFDGITGYELGRELEHDGIFPEMCDLKNAVLITTPCDRDEWYERLTASLRRISERVSAEERRRPAERPRETHRVCGEAVGLREAMLADTETLPSGMAIGRQSAQAVGVYPPGTAVIFPGETITRQAVDLLMLHKANGAKLFGTDGACGGDGIGFRTVKHF